MRNGRWEAHLEDDDCTCTLSWRGRSHCLGRRDDPYTYKDVLEVLQTATVVAEMVKGDAFDGINYRASRLIHDVIYGDDA